MLLVILVLISLYTPSSLAVDNNCEPVAGITPICAIQAPEDIELAPGGRYLLMSHYAGLPATGVGGIGLFDTKTGLHELLYPGPRTDGVADWGSDNCPGSPGEAIASHGIHLSQRDGGQWQLLVVNHGGRESIEFFQLQMVNDKPAVRWRGCVVMPGSAFLNDVVALPGGGLLATQMMDKNDPSSMQSAMAGGVSGHVWEWHPGTQVSIMKGSISPFPNGIQISPDGRYVYLNIYIRGELWKIERSSGRRVGMINIPGPDNSQWAADGRLLVTSHTGLASYDVNRCTSLKQGFCPLAFQVVAVDPDTLETEVIYDHDGSAPMGAGTVAQQLGMQLYIGTFAGDRLYRVQLKKVE